MPDWKQIIRERLEGLPGDGGWESQVIEEMELHLEDRYRELRSAGASDAAARAGAIEELEANGRFSAELRRGAFRPARETYALGSDQGGNLMSSLWRDLKYAFRSMMQKPGFSLMVIGMLATGIAGNAAMFSIFNGLFLRPLPYFESEQLIDVDTTAPKWNLKYVSVSNPDFTAWRANNKTFDGMAFYEENGVNLSMSDGETRRANALACNRNLLEVLRLKPVMGREFTEEEDRPKGPNVVMLGYQFWQNQFHGDRGVLGQVIKVDAVPHTIVGVLPKEAVYPSEADLWAPLQADPRQDGSYHLNGIGRLKLSATQAQAQADLLHVHKAMNADGKRSINESTSPILTPLRERYLGDFRDPAQILLAGVGVVLLIACVNIAGLMLVRGTSRAREIAIRSAIGASRGAIVRQLLTESIAMALIGGLAGVALGYSALGAMLRMIPDGLPPWLDFRMDWRFLLFCAAATTASAVLFGLAPAVQAARVEPREFLVEGSRGSLSRGRRVVLSALIVGEVGLALMLLISSGLLLRAFQQVLRVDPGFRAANVMTFSVWLPESQYDKPEKREAFYRAFLDKLQAIPGVTAASAVNHVPFGGHTGSFYEAVDGRVLGKDEKTPVVLELIAFPNYAETMGMTLVAGRWLRDQEGDPKEHSVLVINESFAKYFFPGVNPVGRFVKQGMQKFEIVGEVRDTRHYGLDQEIRPSVIQPYHQRPRLSMTIAMRTTTEPHAITNAAREAMRSLDPDLPMQEPLTMTERMDKKLWTRRAYSWLFGIFAVVALLLAAAGVYGVTSYVVGQRSREIGIRLALGAMPSQILGSVLRRGMVLVAIGVVIGVGGAFSISRFLESMLAGIPPRDPATYVAVVATIVAVGALANLAPARRAASLNPIQTLRFE